MPINKFYCYQFRKYITTGKHNKNISIYIRSFKIKFQSLPFFTDYIQLSMVPQKTQNFNKNCWISEKNQVFFNYVEGVINMESRTPAIMGMKTYGAGDVP